MNHQKEQSSRIIRNPAYCKALERLAQSLDRLRLSERDEAYLQMEQNERIRKVRMKLFGCAPE